MALSVVVFADEVDGAGIVWRAINKAGSSIHHIANVTEYGCALNQVLKVNATADWACAEDSTGSSSGFTNIASEISPSGNATVLAENSTGTRASFKTISAGTGIQVNNGSQSVIISSTVTDTDTNTTVVSTISASNATLVADNSTSTNNVRMKNISAGSGIQIDNGTNSIIIKMTNPMNMLTGANLTSATTASYRTIFTIPLTANAGNFISAYLITTGDFIAAGPQFMTNYTTSNQNWGNCMYQHPTAATTISGDHIPIVPLGGAVTDSGATSHLNSNATAVLVNCAILSGSNPGSVSINFQAGTTNLPVNILNGSFYFKSP